jgi:hypothetical protein
MQAFFRKSTHHIIRAYALLFSFLSHFTTKRSTVKSTYSTHVPLIKKQIKILLKDGLTRWSDISSYSMLIFIFSFTIELDIICMGSFVTTFQTAFHLILKLFCLKLIFLMFLDRFDVLMSKIIFFKKKNIILMHFHAKNTLKRNCYHTLKHPLLLSALPAYYPLWFTS